mmetsp:Transcript_2113/g.2419  ORF Transcript_2113/g.2419 Transcript_2113/m.2419 type:complete len:91 (-) Transcript_2113:176-448(-)
MDSFVAGSNPIDKMSLVPDNGGTMLIFSFFPQRYQLMLNILLLCLFINNIIQSSKARGKSFSKYVFRWNESASFADSMDLFHNSYAYFVC